MTYQALVTTDDLALTVPAKLNENARSERFLNVYAKVFSGVGSFTVWADDVAGSPRDLYLVTTATYAVDADLPLAGSTDAAAGRVVTIMKADAGGGAVTIDGSGAELINGAATIVLSTQYHYRTLVSDGTQWFVISSS